MLNKIFYLVMVPMVYLAVLVFIAGIIITLLRIGRAPKHKTTLKVFSKGKRSPLQVVKDTLFMPSVRQDKPVLWVFLMLYHLAFLLLMLGHLDLIPGIHLMEKDSPHMVGYGAVGVVLTLALVYFLLRRFRSPVREISTMGDYLILLLLLFTFLSGVIMSLSNSWGENGFVLEKSDFRDYFDILIHFSFADPVEILSGSHYFHVVIHVFLANLFMMIFPFTKFVHTFFGMVVNKIRRGSHGT